MGEGDGKVHIFGVGKWDTFQSCTSTSSNGRIFEVNPSIYIYIHIEIDRYYKEWSE